LELKVQFPAALAAWKLKYPIEAAQEEERRRDKQRLLQQRLHSARPRQPPTVAVLWEQKQGWPALKRAEPGITRANAKIKLHQQWQAMTVRDAERLRT